ncbi:MAG TPA: PCRF domain-containing protein, partial [Terriglobia bacterium]|nr:PCRF domain-containing protein [Terriglobia bacterium]
MPPSSGVFFDAPARRRELEAIEKQIAQPDFWQDPEASQKVMPARRRLGETLETDRQLEQKLADLEAYFELAEEGESVAGELRTELDRLRASLDEVETAALLGGENDRLNAIVTLHPGAGGTESQDWADM